MGKSCWISSLSRVIFNAPTSRANLRGFGWKARARNLNARAFRSNGRAFDPNAHIFVSKGRAFNLNARALGSNVRAFKSNVRAFKSNVRAFKSKERAFKSKERAFKSKERAFKPKARAFKPKKTSRVVQQTFCNFTSTGRSGAAANVMVRHDADGTWHIAAFLDPNAKFAHVENELAYLDLFHTATPAFFKAYQSEARLDDGYHQVRKTIYQLYPLIEHVHQFGPQYMKPAMSVIEKTTAFV